MKKYILFALLFASYFCFGQKIQSDKVDDFNGNRTVSTSIEDLSGKMLSYNYCGITAILIIDKADTAIALYFAFNMYSTGSTNQKDKIQLKLANGSILTLYNQGSYDITTSGRTATVYATLNKDDIDTLLDQNVEMIRIETTAGNMDFTVDQKKKEIIKKTVRLLKEYKL